MIENAIQKVSTRTQNDCLTPKKSRITDNSKFRLSSITTYNFEHNKMNRILKKHWHLLKSDPMLRDIIPAYPSIIYRQG